MELFLHSFRRLGDEADKGSLVAKAATASRPAWCAACRARVDPAACFVWRQQPRWESLSEGWTLSGDHRVELDKRGPREKGSNCTEASTVHTLSSSERASVCSLGASVLSGKQNDRVYACSGYRSTRGQPG